MQGTTILDAIDSVTRKWTKQRKKEERGRAPSRMSVYCPIYRMSIKSAAWKILPECYAIVSGDGEYPASARQLFYRCRPRILEMTGRAEFTYAYFSQVLLPEYQQTHGEAGEWDVTYDARGNFHEPHTKVIVPLGTLDVRQYLSDVDSHLTSETIAGIELPQLFPTRGPNNRFGALLFIEKEGFGPLLKAAKLAERYDLAIMSTKGQSVVACRHLADHICGPESIPLLVLHDFDPYGFSIYNSLAGNSDGFKELRYYYRYEFDVIDLGLGLKDVKKWKLASEPVTYKKDPTGMLIDYEVPKEEREFLVQDRWHGQRVELNAFTSPQFVAWIEAKLKEQNVKKIVPDKGTLTTAYRRAVQRQQVENGIVKLVKSGRQLAKDAKIPKDLTKQIAEQLAAHPELPWDLALNQIVKERWKSNGKAS